MRPCFVAGVSFREDALQLAAFEPGRTLTLEREPGNRHDPNAIAVLDADGSEQVGYVPAGIAAELSGEGELSGVVLEEIRESEEGPRLALVIAIAPAGGIRLEAI